MNMFPMRTKFYYLLVLFNVRRSDLILPVFIGPSGYVRIYRLMNDERELRNGEK